MVQTSTPRNPTDQPNNPANPSNPRTPDQGKETKPSGAGNFPPPERRANVEETDSERDARLERERRQAQGGSVTG